MISGSIGSEGISQLPKGVEVASFRNYDQAVAAVTRLGQEGIELGAISIVGQNLYRVENIVGRITPGQVATQGALQGLTWGLMMGFILALLGTFSIVWLLSIVLIGVCIGVLLAAGSWAFSRNKPQFATHTQILAARYAVLVRAQADRAFQILQGMTGNLGPGGQAGGEPLRSPRLTEYNSYNPGFSPRQEDGASDSFGSGSESGRRAAGTGFASGGAAGIGGGSEVAAGAGETNGAAANKAGRGASGAAETKAAPAVPTEFGSQPDETPKFGVRLTPEEREARLSQRQRADQQTAGAGQARGASSTDKSTGNTDKFKP